MSTSDEDAHILVPCAACGQTNRFPRRRLRDDPRCGRCKQPVFPRAPLAVTDETWSREVDDCPLPVLVDLWAEWCGPCHVLAPTLEAVAAERAGQLKVVKVNVDENPRAVARFAVKSVPLLVVLRGPLEVDRIHGALPKEELDLRLARLL